MAIYTGEEFRLPEHKGIERVIDELREHGLKFQTERCIAIRKDGTRLFDVVGDAHSVKLPEEWAGKCKGAMIAHAHPGLNSALSMDDFFCINGMNAEGNLAVCSGDGSITWSHGFNFSKFDQMTQMMATLFHTPEPFMDEAHANYWRIVAEIDPKAKDAKNLRQDAGWTEFDDRWVVVAESFNRFAAKHGVLKDYYVKPGEGMARVLEANKALIEKIVAE